MIYCCYHKSAPLLRSDILQPIHAGRACGLCTLPIPGDDTGDSISERNPYWSELTVLYWMWKNETDDIVGITHYRRLLNLNDDHTQARITSDRDVSAFGLTKARVSELLAEADIILPPKRVVGKISKTEDFTIYNHYATYHTRADLDLTIRIVLEKHPEAEQTIQRVLYEETHGYWSNLFIASRPVFEAYAAWLFEILFEVERRLQHQLADRDSYQKRVYGFLSERLFNVWLALHPELRILEKPTLFLMTRFVSHCRYLVAYRLAKLFTRPSA